MSLIFDVYRHQMYGEWGVAINGKSASAATVKDGTYSVIEFPTYKVAEEITKRLRGGYTKVTRAKYFKVRKNADGTKCGAFTDKHPELDQTDAVVLYTARSKADDLISLSKVWEEQLEKTDARPEVIANWIEQIQEATDYIVASASHPAIALVLADWALQNNRIVVACASGVPTFPPSEYPSLWKEWLATFFASPVKIHLALEHLGWLTLDKQTTSLRVDVETASEGSWFTDGAAISF